MTVELNTVGNELMSLDHRSLMRRASRFEDDPYVYSLTYASDVFFAEYEKHRAFLCLAIQNKLMSED